MNVIFSDGLRKRGATLVEAVIAVGVLAVAIPIVFGALVESGNCGMAARAETRGTWMVDACMSEIRASREGRSRYFSSTRMGEVFPPGGEVWVLAFAQDGKSVGKLSKALYDSGIRELDGKTVCYIAAMSSRAATVRAGSLPMTEVHISIEYPASANSAKRSKTGFHTHLQ